MKLSPRPRNKFGNVKTGSYASKKEAKRAAELHLLQKAGQIRFLNFQVPFVLIPGQYENGKCVERPVSYRADATYEELTAIAGRPAWVKCVEDSKGMRTAVYILKRKLMLHVHGVRIRET